MSCVGKVFDGKDPCKSMTRTLYALIIHFLAQVGALIDFGEGEDIEESIYEQDVYNQLIIYRQLSFSQASQLDLEQ
jgi:hypothetical protein